MELTNESNLQMGNLFINLEFDGPPWTPMMNIISLTFRFTNKLNKYPLQNEPGFEMIPIINTLTINLYSIKI